MDQLKKGKFRFNKEDLKIIKDILKNKNLNQGGTVMKTKKYRGGGQGYAAREDESLGMRTGAERTKRQSMRDRRDESYGAWGRRPNQMINRQEGGGTPTAASISNRDMNILEGLLGAAGEGTFKEALREAFNELNKKTGKGDLSANSISNRDVQFLKDAYEETKKDTPKHRGTGPTKNAKGGVASFDVGGTGEEIAEAEAKPSVYQPEHKGEGGPNLDASMLLDDGWRIGRIEGGDRQEELMEKAEGKWNVKFEALMDNHGSEIDPDLKKSLRSMQERFNANFLGGVQNTGTATVIEGHDSASSLGETDTARGTGAAVKGTGFKGVF